VNDEISFHKIQAVSNNGTMIPAEVNNKGHNSPKKNMVNQTGKSIESPFLELVKKLDQIIEKAFWQYT
jgi:hypothetical protein